MQKQKKFEEIRRIGQIWGNRALPRHDDTTFIALLGLVPSTEVVQRIFLQYLESQTISNILPILRDPEPSWESHAPAGDSNAKTSKSVKNRARKPTKVQIQLLCRRQKAKTMPK